MKKRPSATPKRAYRTRGGQRVAPAQNARPNWQLTNPQYRYSPPHPVVVDGKPCVYIDGGKLADMAFQGVSR